MSFIFLIFPLLYLLACIFLLQVLERYEGTFGERNYRFTIGKVDFVVIDAQTIDGKLDILLPVTTQYRCTCVTCTNKQLTWFETLCL